MNRLKGKIALVSGSTTGIGAGIARMFRAEGAIVYGSGLSEPDPNSAAPHDPYYRRLDVRHEPDWIAVLDSILAIHGRLDILVNNASITGLEGAPGPQDPEHATLDDWHAVLATNLDGTFLGCKHAIRTMRPSRQGSIINVSSRSGLVGVPGAAAYAASKAAVRNHSKTVALYCAEQGLAIRCNSIHPAAILTPMWEPTLGNGPDREERIQSIVRDTPLRRFGRIEEVAAVAVLLASDEATYITGSELNIDGGLLAGSTASQKVATSENHHEWQTHL